MTVKRYRQLWIAAIALAATPALAHHSFAAFDLTRTTEIQGTLKEFKFTNPHSWMVVSVTDDKGNSAEWTIEGLSPGALAAKGIKRSAFKSGDKIAVTLNPLRSGENGGSLVSARLADGSVVTGGPGQ
jgi:hypothetical protein